MRIGTSVAVCLLAVGCAHAPPEPPTLAGRTFLLRFDRTSITSVPSSNTSVAMNFVSRANLSRGEHGTWRGILPCPAQRIPGEIETTDDAVTIRQRRYPVETTPEEIIVHEAHADLVFRRSDGGPVPAELIVPLMMVVDPLALCPVEPTYAPGLGWGYWLEVDGIGRVEAFAVPLGEGPLYVRARNPPPGPVNAHPLPVTLVAAQ